MAGPSTLPVATLRRYAGLTGLEPIGLELERCQAHQVIKLGTVLAAVVVTDAVGAALVVAGTPGSGQVLLVRLARPARQTRRRNGPAATEHTDDAGALAGHVAQLAPAAHRRLRR